MNKFSSTIFSAVLDRLQSEWKLKLFLLVILNLVVFLPYAFLQRHQFFPPITMPASFCDRLIPFVDRAVWVYLSIYLLMPIGPFLMNRREQIFRYVLGILLIAFIADTVFFFWPTSCLRPDISQTSGAYRALVSVDAPFHAFPSLHAAFAVFSAACGAQRLRELHTRPIWRGALWLWAALILAATLLTKQHVVVDILAGTALGFAAYFSVFRQSKNGSKIKLSSSIATNPTIQPETILP